MKIDLRLPIVFAALGFLFSSRTWIKHLDALSPISGLIIYYIILTTVVLLLEYFGLIVAGIKFDSLSHTIGTMLIIFSFFIIVSWESCYVNTITKGDCDGVSTVYLQSEDGATYYFWSLFTSNIELARILTYVITPFVLTLAGQFLITRKVELW